MSAEEGHAKLFAKRKKPAQKERASLRARQEASAQFSMRTSEHESGSTPSVLGEWAGFQMSMLRIVTCWQSNGCTVQNGCGGGKKKHAVV